MRTIRSQCTLGLVALTLSLAAQRAHSQQAPAGASSVSTPRFEVASVKENRDGVQAGTRRLIESPGGLVMRGRTVSQMLEWAYGLPARDIIGGPDWVREKTFDIDARTGSQETTRLQLLLMLRSLLRERFSLDAEFETREGNRYALMVVRADGKLGPEMHPSTATCGRRTPGGTFYDPTNGPLKMDNCGVAVASGNGRVSFLGGMRATADDLARSISPHLDRPVVDKTGLTVEYDFIAGIPRAPIDATGGEIFTMIREQLGLKLQPERGDVRLLVIRSIAQPTPN